MPSKPNARPTPPSPEQIARLETQGCFSPDWSRVRFAPGSDLRLVRSSRFYGDVSVGVIEGADQGIFSSVIRDCYIGSRPYINAVTGGLRGLTVGDDAVIDTCGRIEAQPGTSFGVGTEVAVLDETGSRPVYIYPGLSAQMAWLMAHYPRWTEQTVVPCLDAMRERMAAAPAIGHRVQIRDVKCMLNVHVDSGVRIEGASRLVNGSIINNGHPGSELAFMGDDVDAEDFIIEDGRVECGTLLRHVYVGQGAELAKLFSAHDSLFFANCSLECGEACAVLAGPYTVSMHKSTLLIAGEYSFFNAGSGTNFSNHMYKLGPVHFGLLQRGVKTASSAYVMWGGKIGAFSLVMGAHRSHPDTTPFPFSYIFADAKGSTVIAPGQMLRSCGLARDEMKWPKRDRRIKARLPMHDNVHFHVLNPLTVSAMIAALPLLQEIEASQPDSEGMLAFSGLRLRPSAVRHARDLYELAVAAYVITARASAQGAAEPAPCVWRDVAGQLMTQADIDYVLQAGSIEEAQERIDAAFAAYPERVAAWLAAVVTPEIEAIVEAMPDAPARLLALTEADRATYRAALGAEVSGLLS